MLICLVYISFGVVSVQICPLVKEGLFLLLNSESYFFNPLLHLPSATESNHRTRKEALPGVLAESAPTLTSLMLGSDAPCIGARAPPTLPV